MLDGVVQVAGTFDVDERLFIVAGLWQGLHLCVLSYKKRLHQLLQSS